MDSIGKIITGTESRDAIHVAIIPARAERALKPGARVRCSRADDRSLVTLADSVKPVGIVDPYLKANVRAGEWFWLFLFPNTVTNLKHVWTHPAFDDVTTTPDRIEDALVITARQRIAEMAAELKMTPEGLMDSAKDWLENSEYTMEYGTQYRRNTFYNLANEFWDHYATVTRTVVDGEYREPFFSCSCG